ncbi:MAG: CBS domain-containing protein [Myxococcota bacterium]
MGIKVDDLMTERVVTAEPHYTVERVRGLLDRNEVSAVPIVDTEGHPVGIVSARDLRADVSGGTPVKKIMTEKVYTVPRYEDVHIAARVMRNHRIHRVVVTDEQRVVGVLSAFDLLQLVEDHRFVMKNPPTESKRKGTRRR